MHVAFRFTGTIVLAAALMAISAGTALGHECMAANRSQQGEQAVGHSPMWLSENMATHEAYEFTFLVVFGVQPTEKMLDEAVSMHIEQGLQEWASFFEHHTLLANPKSGDDTPAANDARGRRSGDRPLERHRAGTGHDRHCGRHPRGLTAARLSPG